MGSGFKDWAAGDVLTAADVDGYLMRQTVMTFADASARDTALSGVLDEGMVAYLEDVNALTVYNGSAWVAVIDSDVLTVDTANNRVGINESSPSYALDVTGDINASGDLRIGGTTIGAGTAYTPSHTNITVGNGTETARYVQVNELVLVSYKLVWGSTTSFGGTIEVGLPFTSAAGAEGAGVITEAGVSNSVVTASVAASADKATVRPHNISGSFARWDTNIDASNPFTWGTNDELRFSIVYEVA